MSYEQFILKYNNENSSLSDITIELIDLLKSKYDSSVNIESSEVDGIKVIIIENIKNEEVRDVVYLVVNREKLNQKHVSTLINTIEHKYRREAISYNFTIVSLAGYEDYKEDNSIDISSYQQFGGKLDDITWLEQLLNPNKITVDLVGHNQYAYDRISKALKKCDEVAAIQPTGSGKSYLAARCILDYINGPVILLSSSREILQQFKRNFKWMNSENIIMMTYSKLMKLSDEEFNKLLENPPSLYMLDEYHRCGAKRWGERIKILIDRVKENNKQLGIYEGNSLTKFIGLTATPIRDLDKERNMTKELFNGNIASEMTLSEAILRKILPMPRYVVVFHSLDEDIKKVETRIDKSRRSSKEKNQLRKELNTIIRKWTESNDVAHILKKYVTNERKFIVFCEDTEHITEIMARSVEWFKSAFGEDTKVHTYKVLYRYSSSNKELKKFLESEEDGFHLLFNIEKLTEGMHAPGISGVLLIRKTQSKIKFLQMQGRCLQTDSINQPLILDLVNNISNVKGVSLENDLRQAAKRENILREKHKLDTISDEEIEQDFIHYIHDEAQDVIELFTRLEGKISVTWDEFYDKLKAYYEVHKTSKVPSIYEDEYLYRWTIEQKRARREGRICIEQIEKLDALGFDWEYKERIFENMYERLVNYYNKYGHSRVKEDYEDQELYRFVTGRRALHAKGQLSEEEFKRLEKLNFIWNVNDEEWMQGYREMLEFYKIHKHSNPTESNASPHLVAWKNRLRKLYKEKKITPERKSLLDKLGFIWDILGEQWEDTYNQLAAYKEKFGDTNIPKDSVEYKSLYQWLQDMRKLRRKGNLSKEREDKLNNLGVVWDPLEARWEANYLNLIEYHNTHNTFEINRKENIVLYRWATSQLREYRAGKLPEHRKLKLEKIGFFDNIE